MNDAGLHRGPREHRADRVGPDDRGIRLARGGRTASRGASARRSGSGAAASRRTSLSKLRRRSAKPAGPVVQRWRPASRSSAWGSRNASPPPIPMRCGIRIVPRAPGAQRPRRKRHIAPAQSQRRKRPASRAQRTCRASSSTRARSAQPRPAPRFGLRVSPAGARDRGASPGAPRASGPDATPAPRAPAPTHRPAPAPAKRTRCPRSRSGRSSRRIRRPPRTVPGRCRDCCRPWHGTGPHAGPLDPPSPPSAAPARADRRRRRRAARAPCPVGSARRRCRSPPPRRRHAVRPFAPALATAGPRYLPRPDVGESAPAPLAAGG